MLLASPARPGAFAPITQRRFFGRPQKSATSNQPSAVATQLGFDSPAVSEPERISSGAERRANGGLIQAQSTAKARAMARIYNDERTALGVMSGPD